MRDASEAVGPGLGLGVSQTGKASVLSPIGDGMIEWTTFLASRRSSSLRLALRPLRLLREPWRKRPHRRGAEGAELSQRVENLVTPAALP